MHNQASDTRLLRPISPEYDPWDPLHSLTRFGRHRLTSVEFTVTHMCNMRCEHCAVGEGLVLRDPEKLPLALILNRLEEVEHLETISITGGEPMLMEETVRETILPLLKYARERGVWSQLNSNLTLDLARYELIAPYLDVLHISYNYAEADDFVEVGFARTSHPVGRKTAVRLLEQMMDNAVALSKGGLFVSAESMINTRTHLKLPQIHQLIVEMGCKRHEVHPMYPSSFARELPVLPLDQLREAIIRLLDKRDRNVWMLFGTLPFFRCSPLPEDRALVERMSREPNVTIRNDPDGRNRLNVNLFTGDVFVTDFADVPPLGNVKTDRLDDVFDRWLEHPLAKSVNCHCPQVSCCGPNLLVSRMYYEGVDFTTRQAIV